MKFVCCTADENLKSSIGQEADRQRWSAVCIEDKESISSVMQNFNPDLFLVDTRCPKEVEWWKQQMWTAQKPIVILNQEGDESFIVAALENGADECLTHPKSMPLLSAKLKALARRIGPTGHSRYVARLNLMLDSEQQKVNLNGGELKLTSTEFKILRELATDQEGVITRSEIQSRVFGPGTGGNRSLDVHICSLRKILAEHNLRIDSVRGVGYRLDTCRF